MAIAFPSLWVSKFHNSIAIGETENEIFKQALLTRARVYVLDHLPAKKLRAEANHLYTKAATFLDKGFSTVES